MVGAIVELSEKQLRRLSEKICKQEKQQILNIPYDCEPELRKNLRACNHNHETIETLLDFRHVHRVDEHRGDEATYHLWHLVWELLKALVNFGLHAINNYTARKEFLERVVAFKDERVAHLLGPRDRAKIHRLTSDTDKFKEAINNFNSKHRSVVSRMFSQRIQEERISFEDLVKRYKRIRGLQGPFKNLSEKEKFLVYEDIIKASGRGQIIDQEFAADRRQLVKGFALLTFVAAVTVWDIYLDPSTPLVERITRNMKDIASSITGSTVGHLVRSALMRTAWAAVAGATTLIAVLGFVIGVGVGMFLACLGDILFDAIFGSGGEHDPSIENVSIFLLPMEDGE